MAVVTENPAEGAFQLYTIANKEAVSPLPDSLALKDASVLPLAVSTATVALYTPKQLALPLPTVSPEPKNQVLLVWGGSSSVGGMGIQFGKLSGYKVAATCSPRNNDYVKSLGADFVFDYSSPSVVEDIVNGLQGQEVVGIFNAIGGEQSGIACNGVMSQVKTPSSRRHVATVPPLPSSIPDGVTVEALGSAATMFFDDRKKTAAYIWQEFLPQALEKGVLKAVPEPLIVGTGLEKVSQYFRLHCSPGVSLMSPLQIQEALDTLEAGVSAKKVVVRLSEEE